MPATSGPSGPFSHYDSVVSLKPVRGGVGSPVNLPRSQRLLQLCDCAIYELMNPLMRHAQNIRDFVNRPSAWVRGNELFNGLVIRFVAHGGLRGKSPDGVHPQGAMTIAFYHVPINAAYVKSKICACSRLAPYIYPNKLKPVATKLLFYKGNIMPQQVGIFENCLSYAEAAKLIGCAEGTLRNSHDEWGVPSIRIAGRIWFLQPEVEAWARERAYAHRHQDAAARNVQAAHEHRMMAMAGK